VRLFPLYHPAAALYTRSLLDTLRADFARIPDLLALEVPEQPAPPEPEPEPEPEPVAEAAESAPAVEAPPGEDEDEDGPPPVHESQLGLF
jgi:DNA polymerase